MNLAPALLRSALACALLSAATGALAQEAPPQDAPAQEAPSEAPDEGLVPFEGVGAEVEVALRTSGERVLGQLLAERADGSFLLESGGWRVELPRSQVLAIRSARGWRAPIVDMHEDAALAAEGQDQPAAVYQSYVRMVHALAAAQRAGALSAEESAPAAEVALVRLSNFGLDLGRAEEVARECSTWGESDVFTPLVRSRAKTLFANALLHLGEPGLASEVQQQLGVLSEFFVIGPFDNERGRGFQVASPPESAIELGTPLQGKEGPVSWRPTPAGFPMGGVVDFESMCTPDDQGLAYALTYVHVERPTPVALRLGSDEAAKLWLNDRLVLSRELRRTYSPDQDAVGVVLQPGWTRVLLKVCDQTGNWCFRLRVTAPDGGPTQVRAATSAEIAQLAAGAELAASPEDAEIDAGPVAAFEARVATNPSDWRAWFQKGFLHLAQGGHDETEHPDRLAFARAAALRPRDANLRVFLAATLGGGGEFSVNAEHNARRQTLEEALKIDPSHVEARATLAEYYLDEMEQVETAASYLTGTPRASLRSQLAWLRVLRGRGQGSLAQARLRTLLDEAEGAIQREEALLIPKDLLDEAISAARDRGDAREQLRLLEELLNYDGSDLWTLIQCAQLYRQSGRPELAEQLLRHAIACAPWVPGLHTELAGLYAGVRSLDPSMERAEATLRTALEIRSSDPELIEQLAALLERRDQRIAARALYERSLELDPKRVGTKRYLEFLDRGDAQRVRFETAWIIEPEPLLEAAKLKPLDPKLTHRILLRQQVEKLNADGTRSSWHQELLRVESREGVRALAGYPAVYEDDQRIEVQLARVHRSGGAQEDAPVGSAGGISGGDSGGRRAFRLRFPPLQPGDVIEVRYRTDDLRQGFFGDYYGEQFQFQDQVPLDRMRVALIAPAARTLYFHSPGGRGPQPQASEANGLKQWIWEASEIAALEPEPNMPWLKEVVPQVQVSTFADWDRFASWYWGLVKAQHEADESIKAKVAELTQGATSVEDKVRRIYNFVVTDIRYSDAWEFGVHGFKPYSATKIYARRFGDCKDKATLIGTMCGVIGVEAHPVLIFGEDGRGVEDLTLPLMGHFNHCISYVRLPDGRGLFLDGTAEFHPYGNLPSMDYGARVVVITPEGGLVKEIPFRGPEGNSVRERHEVTLGADGKARVESTLSGRGTFEVVLRQLMTTEGRRVQVLEPRYGERYTGAKIESVKASDPTDLDAPLEVKVESVLPGMLRKTAGGGVELRELRSWLFDLIYLRNQNLSSLAADSERTQDVVLPVPSMVDETVRYRLPEGASVQSVPEGVELQTPFGSYQRVYERKGGVLEVRRVLRLTTNRIPRAEYEAFRRFVETIDRAERERPVLSFPGGAQ